MLFLVYNTNHKYLSNSYFITQLHFLCRNGFCYKTEQNLHNLFFCNLTGFFFLPRFWIAIKCLYILMCIFLKMSFSSAITPRPVSVTLVGTCAIFPQILGPILLLVLSICLYPHNTAFHIFISRPSFCLHFSCFSLDLQ